MRIYVGNSFSTIEGEIPPGSLPFFEYKYRTMRKVPGKNRPEWVTHTRSLFHYPSRSFPTGLTYQFRDYLRNVCDTDPEIVDTRVKPSQPIYLPANYPYPLRSHQLAAFSATLNRSRGLIISPTGSGKTLMAAKIIEYFACKSMYLVNNIDLLGQVSDVLIDVFGSDYVGIIGDSVFDPKAITVSTVQTLWSRIDTSEVAALLKSIDLLIGDEIHHISNNIDRSKEAYPGNSLYEVIQRIDAYYKFGFSARINQVGTLRRRFLEATIGRPLYQVKYNELREKGYLADVCVFIVKTPNLRRHNNYNTAYKEEVQKNHWVHNLISDAALFLAKLGRTSVVMVTRLTKTEVVGYKKDKRGNDIAVTEKDTGHGGILFDYLETKSPGAAMLITGKDPAEERAEYRRLLNSKTLKIAVGTVLREGVDIPTLDAVFYVCGGRAETDTNDDVTSSACIQAIGRVLRNPGGLSNPKRAVHVDILYSDHGSLQKHSIERVRAYKEHGYTVRLVEDNDLSGAMQRWIDSGVKSGVEIEIGDNG